MQHRGIDHLNPSRLKIPYHLCNGKKDTSSRLNPSYQTNPSQNFEDQYMSSNTYGNGYDELSDENHQLRHQLQALKKYNVHLRRKLEQKQKELGQTDKQFKQTLIKYNKRLETSNVEMAGLLMEESRDYYKSREKNKSNSKSKLLAIKNELISMDCTEINKLCAKSRASPARQILKR